MLQRIRERITGWIAGLVIVLVGGAFVLFGVQYYVQQSGRDGDVAATVNGVKITPLQVHRAYTQMLQRMMTMTGQKSVPSDMRKQLKSMALQSEITNTALTTTLEKTGFGIGLPQVKEIVAQDPQMQVNGQFSQSRFSQMLAMSGLSPMQFFDRVKSQVIMNQAIGGITSSAFMTPSEIAHIYRLENQRRAFGYFLVPASMFKGKITIAQKDIVQYYKKNKSTFTTPEKVQVAYLELSPQAIAKTVSVTKTQAKSYYETNISNYTVPARWQLKQITVPVKKGASDAQLAAAQKNAAKIASTWRITGKAPAGARVVILSAAQLNDQVRSILSGMKKNQLSSPLRTQDGYSVLQMIEHTPAKVKPFASVQKNLMAMLQHQKVNSILSKKSSQLADITYTTPDSLKAAAKALNLPIKTSGLMTKSGEKKGLFANKDLLTAVFSDNVLKEGNNSNPVSLPDGSQVVVRIAKKVPAKVLPLSQVTSAIKKALLQNKEKAKAGLLAYQLQQQLSAGKSPAALSSEFGVAWRLVKLVAKDSPQLKKLPKNIVTTAFSTPVSAMSGKGKPVGVNTVLLSDGDYAVVAISQVVNASSNKATVKAREALSDKMTLLWGQLLQHYYIKSIVDASKIKINKK